jgi:hypothetical protein
MSILQGNSCSIGQKSGGIWTVQTDLQQIYPRSDRLLERYHIHFIIGKQGISPPGYADPDIHACGIPEHTTPQSLDFLAGITFLVSE